jgi:hypothetical protein
MPEPLDVYEGDAAFIDLHWVFVVIWLDLRWVLVVVWHAAMYCGIVR